jgi:hypothetical protein
VNPTIHSPSQLWDHKGRLENTCITSLLPNLNIEHKEKIFQKSQIVNLFHCYFRWLVSVGFFAVGFPRQSICITLFSQRDYAASFLYCAYCVRISKLINQGFILFSHFCNFVNPEELTPTLLTPSKQARRA